MHFDNSFIGRTWWSGLFIHTGGEERPQQEEFAATPMETMRNGAENISCAGLIHLRGQGSPPGSSSTFPAILDWPLKKARVHIVPRAAKYKWQHWPASICPHDQLETLSSLSHGLIDGCDLLCAE